MEAAKTAASMGISVYTIGVGSAQGQPIPMKGGLLKDSQGNIVVTKLDEATLKKSRRRATERTCMPATMNSD